MTDTNKLEIEKEALIFYADRLKMQVFEKQFEIDKALEQSNGYLDIIRELNIKIDQLEKDLLSLHKTLESTESELAKVKSEKEKLPFRNKNQTDIITPLQSKNEKQ